MNKNRLERPEIEVKNGNIDLAIKKLNGMIKKSGKLMEYRDRMFYERPASIRNKKKNEIKNRKKYETI